MRLAALNLCYWLPGCQRHLSRPIKFKVEGEAVLGVSLVQSNLSFRLMGKRERERERVLPQILRDLILRYTNFVTETNLHIRKSRYSKMVI